MTSVAVSRRRFIAIAGAAAGLSFLPSDAAPAATIHGWQGAALGARASIRLVHTDPAEASRIIRTAVREIERLEGIFSLYRFDSAVARLNRDGRLDAPPLDLVDLLNRAASVSRASDGAFDLTVQPLWLRYRDHFAADPNAASPPPVEDVLPLVDWRGVTANPDGIGFDRPGMAITPNGIAQGYVTDRVADLLRRNGIDSVALDLGEVRTMGQRPDRRDWVVGIEDPADRSRVLGRIPCSGMALATSGGYGTVFDGRRRFGHLIDPRDGTTAPVLHSVSVRTAEACAADAWSTALSVMSPSARLEAARRLVDSEVYVAEPIDGLRKLA